MRFTPKVSLLPCMSWRISMWGLYVWGAFAAAAQAAAQGAPGDSIHWPVVSGAVPRVPRLQLLSTPQLVLGTADGPDHTLFNGVAGAVRLSNGVIAIGDAGNNRVLFFDGRGGFLRTVGRLGDGPGEYRQPRWFGRCSSGNMAVHDGAHARLTLLSPSGELRGTEPLPVGANFDKLLWCSGERRLIMLLNRPKGPVRRGEYANIPTTIVLTNGVRIDTVSTPGPQEYYIGREIQMLTGVPLGRGTLAAGSPSAVFVCTNQNGHCEVFDTAGARLRQFDVSVLRRPMTLKDWKSATAQHFVGEPSKTMRKTGPALLNEISPRDVFPLLDEIRADARGSLWVRTFDNFTTDIATWLVLSPTGVPIRLVATKRSLHILEIGTDYLLGLTRDDDGVERVEEYRFTASPPQPRQ